MGYGTTIRRLVPPPFAGTRCTANGTDQANMTTGLTMIGSCFTMTRSHWSTWTRRSQHTWRSSVANQHATSSTSRQDRYQVFGPDVMPGAWPWFFVPYEGWERDLSCIHLSGPGMGNIRDEQQHSRRNCSHLLVFRKRRRR